MTDRDNRYNATEKGKARNAKHEAKRKRKRYRARWMKAYRSRKAGGA